MSHWFGLDEYEEEALLTELISRAERRRMGLCDYCGRPKKLKPCKYPERHKR